MTDHKDIWTKQDDILLAEAVIKHISEASTQLNAFQEVAEKLGRTTPACGFRWNSSVRKNYENEITEAILLRNQAKNKKLKKEEPTQIPVVTSLYNPPIKEKPLDLIVSTASAYKQYVQAVETDLELTKSQLRDLQFEHQMLQDQFLTERPWI